MASGQWEVCADWPSQLPQWPSIKRTTPISGEMRPRELARSQTHLPAALRSSLTPGNAAPSWGAEGPSARDAGPSPGLCSLARPRVRSPRRLFGSGTWASREQARGGWSTQRRRGCQGERGLWGRRRGPRAPGSKPGLACAWRGATGALSSSRGSQSQPAPLS